MIAKMSSGSGFYGLIDYNEKKVKKGEAKRLVAKDIFVNHTAVKTKDISGQLDEWVGEKLDKKSTLHISLNFPKEDTNIDEANLEAIAESFMVKMGYTDTPYIIYEHEDRKHQHVHIVATRVDKNGALISDAHNFKKANKTCRELEKEYNLKNVPETKKDEKPRIEKPEILESKNQHYKKAEVKHHINNSVLYVLQKNKPTSLEDFQKKIKEQFLINVEPVTNEYNESIGLVYNITDAEGKRVSQAVKGSSFYYKYTYNNLQKIFAKNSNKLKENYKEQIVKDKVQLESKLKELFILFNDGKFVTEQELINYFDSTAFEAIILKNAGGAFGWKFRHRELNEDVVLTRDKDIKNGRNYSFTKIKDYIVKNESEIKEKENQVKEKKSINELLNERWTNWNSIHLIRKGTSLKDVDLIHQSSFEKASLHLYYLSKKLDRPASLPEFIRILNHANISFHPYINNEKVIEFRYINMTTKRSIPETEVPKFFKSETIADLLNIKTIDYKTQEMLFHTGGTLSKIEREKTEVFERDFYKEISKVRQQYNQDINSGAISISSNNTIKKIANALNQGGVANSEYEHFDFEGKQQHNPNL